MDTTNSLKLIDGQFTPAEARRVISDLISSKINYHAMEAFSIKERFNGDVSSHEKRIGELKECQRLLDEITGNAAAGGLNVKVDGFITMTFVAAK